ncbi:MAG TPA: CHAD domain-containing protein [Acetobacteraceae bacterium]|nr:CHAD domain-containing protein [Acetobacteraceae bacterium]
MALGNNLEDDDLHRGRNAQEELELKFLAPADTLDRVRASPPLARHARNNGTVRHLEAVYYDTADRTLFGHGLSLRVRRSGLQFVQTLKRATSRGGPFARNEWENTVDGMSPDFSVLPLDEIGAPLGDLAPTALDPVFATKVQRRTQQLDLPGAVVEVAFDDGLISSGARSEPLSELELEVKAGNARALYDLGLQLLDVAPLRIGTRSKADRGYCLAFGDLPRPTKAAVPDVTTECTVDDVVGLLLGSCQQHMLANQAAAEAGIDPEGVHQMRVALRRMRTVAALLHQQLGLPSLESLSAEAKWLGTLLGAAREWDVFLTETLGAPSAVVAGDAIDFAGLRNAAQLHRDAAYAALREALGDVRYSRFQLSMLHWIQSKAWRNELRSAPLAVLLEPAGDFGARTLAKLHRKALKRGAHFRHLPPDRRHKVRIALKNLRYATEFFRDAQPAEAGWKDYLRGVEDLQEALGHDNDASMTAPLLSMLAQDEPSAGVSGAIGAVMGWQARGRLAEGKRLRRQWRRFKTATTPWSS